LCEEFCEQTDEFNPASAFAGCVNHFEAIRFADFLENAAPKIFSFFSSHRVRPPLKRPKNGGQRTENHFVTFKKK
jgi:hypothetical protein